MIASMFFPVDKLIYEGDPQTLEFIYKKIVYMFKFQSPSNYSPI